MMEFLGPTINGSISLTPSILVLTYIVVEFFFYLVFIFYYKRMANDLTTKSIKPFRDVGNKRHLLFKRIVERMDTRCKLEKKELEEELNSFLKNWFFPPSYRYAPNSEDSNVDKSSGHNDDNIATSKDRHRDSNSKFTERMYTSLSSLESISKDEKESLTTNESSLCKEDLLAFFSWAFFDKHYHDLNEEWEHGELDNMFAILESYGIVYRSFKSQSNPTRLTPRCMTLEECNPLHRPLALYGIFFILRMIGYLVLRCFGFRRQSVSLAGNGNKGRIKSLHYWYLDDHFVPDKQDTLENVSPLLFFHGIAPAGLTFYLPMMINVIIKGATTSFQKSSVRHPIFLFENLPITCSLVFDALSEEETTKLVDKALSSHGYHQSPKKKKKNDLILCGHSFGSFQMTWLIKSPLFQNRMKKVVLLDPVSILLSEPDVVTNFLYNCIADAVFENDRFSGNSILEYVKNQKIRMLASSELGIEYYLRRHFAWYNSELWLEDIPKSVEVYVFVSEKDEIIDTAKVTREIKRFPNVNLTYWEDVGHAALLTHPELWDDFSDGLFHYRDISVTKKIN